MAHMATSRFTPGFCWNWRPGLPGGGPPARALPRSFRGGSSLSLPCLMRSAVNSTMWIILVERACSNRVPVIGEVGTSRKSAGPFIVSLYWCRTPPTGARAREAVRLDARGMAGPETVGDGFDDPVDVQAEEVEELAGHHRDLGGVDAVRTEDRAAPALGALEEVVEPLLDDGDGELAPAGEPPQDLPRGREVVPVDRAQELGPEHGHVLGVAAADIEMALVGACAAAHADVHEDL